MSATVVAENLTALADLLQLVARSDPRVPTLCEWITAGSFRRKLPAPARYALEIESVNPSVLAQLAIIAVSPTPIGHDLLRDLHRRVLRWHGRGRQ